MKSIPACVSTFIALNVTWSIRTRLTLVALAVLAAPFAANGQTVRYHVVPLAELSTLPTASCVPTAINSNDVVVGYCGANGDPFAVRWQSNGAVVDLGKWEGGTFTRAWGLNAAGQIVGDGDDGDLRFKALVRGGSGWIGIDGTGGSFQTATGITHDGVVFGNYSSVGSPATATWDPVFWTYDSRRDRYERNDLEKAPGTPVIGWSGAFVFGVNSVGVAVGQVETDLLGNRAGLWKNDASHSLEMLRIPPAGGSTAAVGVSDDGRVVGRMYGVAEWEHAVLWQNDTGRTPVDLGTLAGDVRSEAYGVNVLGQVVGGSFDSLGRGRGFIYQDGTLTALTTLLDTLDNAWTVNEPAGINNHGTIIATATRNGVRHPVMLVPFVSTKATQTISFTLSAGPFRFGDSPFPVSATSTSGLPVAFQASGACIGAGTTVTIVGAGMCTVIASQAGDADWDPAAEVIQNAMIGKADALIVVTPYSVTYDGAPHTATSTATGVGGVDLSSLLSLDGTTHTDAGSYADEPWSFIGGTNYNDASGTVSNMIRKADASIVVTPYSVTYDGAPHTATVVATGVGGVNLSSLVSLDGTTHTDAGTYPADAWSFTSPNYNDENGTVSNSIAQATQAITFDALAPRTFGDAPFTVAASSGSGLAVTFGATGNCSVSGNQVTIAGAGSCNVTASQAGNANYAAAPDVSQSFTIAQAAQAIAFGALANRTFGDAPFTVSASGGASGNAVTFAAAGTCAVEVELVTLSGVGNCTITASQAGNTNYAAAENVSRSFVIAKAAQSITFGPLGNHTFGDAPFTVSASGGASGKPVTFAAAGGACAVTVDLVTIIGAGTCTITASQAGDADWGPADDVSQTVMIGKADASIVVTPYSVTYDGAPHTATVVATGVGGVNLSGLVSLEGTTHTDAGTYPADAWSFTSPNYNDENGTVSNSIAQATQAITFDALAPRTFGDAPFTISATGGASGIAVTFAAAGNCSITGNQVTISGADSCTITASQSGNTNYAAAENVSQSFAIAKAAQSIIFGALAPRTFGDAPFTVAASSGSGLAVTFAAAGNCTVSSNLVTLTAAGSCTITASQAGNANYLPASPVPQSFSIAPAAPAESPLVNPGPQTSQEGDQVELSLVATRVRGTFSASNLPNNLKIDNKGAIRGHVGRGAAAGSPYNVVVTYTAPDGVKSTVAFSWTILPSGPRGQGGQGNHDEKDDQKREGDDRR